MNTDVIETTAEVVPIIPTEQMAEINATDQGMATLRSRAMELSELGTPTTKEQYEEVHRITMVSVKVRTESDKLAKRLAAPYKDKYDQIRAEGKRIGDHAAASEALTRPLKEQYEAEQERLKIEAEKAAAAKIQGRVDSINKLGMVFNGSGYTSPDYDFSIDAVEVQALPDDEWNDLYQTALSHYEEHQAVLKQQREQAEAEEKRMQERIHALSLLGFGFNGKSYSSLYSLDFHISPDEIKSLPDDKWDLLFDSAAARYNDYKSETERLRKLAEEQQAKEKELADARAKFEKEQAEFREEQQRVAKVQADAIRAVRVAKLTAVGFIEAADKYLTLTGTDWYFSPIELENMTDQEVDQAVQSAVGMNEQRQAKIVADEKQRVADAKATADEAKAKLKADRERTTRLKGDKKTLNTYLTKYSIMTFPKLDQPETTEFVQQFGIAIDRVVNEFRRKLEEL